MPKLDAQGVEYRLSVPGARVVDGVLNANVDLPGLPIQYSLDGKHWNAYDAAAKPTVSGKVWLRTTSFDGKRTGRVTELN